MSVIIVFVLLVSGFIYCHEHPKYAYKLHRYEGQYLYLQAGKLGLRSLFYSLVLNLGLIKILTFNFTVCAYSGSLGIDYIEWISHQYEVYKMIPTQNPKLISWVIVLSCTSLVMPYITKKAYVAYKKWKHKLESGDQVRLFLMSKIFSDSPLDDLLFNSMLQQDSVMICLNDRKVYVGKIASMGEPNENEGADQEINLLPLVSGYRDKDHLEVRFTTSYKNVGDDLSVIIKQENIVSARKYDFSLWDKFKTDSTKIKKSPISSSKAKKASA